MAQKTLSRADIRKRYNNDAAKEILRLMKLDWTVSIDGGYPQLHCPCDPTAGKKQYIRLPKTSGKGSSSLARKIRDHAAKCPDKHELM